MKRVRLGWTFLGVVLFSTICNADVRVLREPARGKVIAVEVVPATPTPTPYYSPSPSSTYFPTPWGSPTPWHSPSPSYSPTPQPSPAFQTAIRALTSSSAASLGTQALSQYGYLFGAYNAQAELTLKSQNTDALGMRHLRFSQIYQGVPVFSGELIVHLNANGSVRSINGSFEQNIVLNTTPSLTPDDAVGSAVASWESRYGGIIAEVAEPTLWVISPAALSNQADGPYYLAWGVRVRNAEASLDLTLFVDAHSGTVVYEASNVRKATSREVWDCSNISLGCVLDRYDPVYRYTFGRSEGQPERGVNPILQTANDDLLYDRLEIVRRFFVDAFNRNGANGQGGLGDGRTVPVSTVRAYLTPALCPRGGDYSPGSHIRICQTSTLIDLVAHEYSHDVVSFLNYSGQSGSLDEAFAYFNAEVFEKYLTGAVDWLNDTVDECEVNFADPKSSCGSEYALPGGPDHFYDRVFQCSYLGDDFNIHWNALVPMKAASLASKGGSFNGCSISPIGIERLAQIVYRAYTQYFTPSTNFNGAYAYLLQACRDIYGATSPVCYQVDKAFRAVEMDQPGKCTTTPQHTPVCDLCPSDANKTDPGCNGCGIVDVDSDHDGAADCYDECPNDATKVTAGRCGCGIGDVDLDLDGTPDCNDECPNDPQKTEVGVCGCGVAEHLADADGDGYYGPSSCPAAANDCNDSNANIRPGAQELCDGVDNDCDSEIDENLGLGERCTNGIGACQRAGQLICDGAGGVTCSAVPGTPGTEFCDGVDNDCDGVIDDGLTFDADGDGYTSTGSCTGTKNDCNDAVASIHPGANDICGNGIDENCDGRDAACPSGCTDTDGGNVPSIYGVTKYYSLPFADRCLTTQYVVEFYCGSDAHGGVIMPHVQLHRCSVGSRCTAGACSVPYRSLSRSKLSKRKKERQRTLQMSLKKKAKRVSKKNS